MNIKIAVQFIDERHTIDVHVNKTGKRFEAVMNQGLNEDEYLKDYLADTLHSVAHWVKGIA